MDKSYTQPWYQNAIFYELYVRAFRDSDRSGNGDLQGVIEKLDYIESLGVDCIWLLPIFPSPLKDDGYDVADYLSIHEDYGTLHDFERLIDAAHKRHIRIIIDLVVNHTSDQHEWFTESRSSRDNPRRDWYIWSDTDQRYHEARIIFLDKETSNWAYDEKTRQYYWHRFYASQPDLNYDNPEVRQAMLDIIAFWLDLGVDGFRVDAVPYLYERDGTICENLPETHQYLQTMRRFIEERWPEAIMLCEANQPASEVVDYFGAGDECHMAFHFPVMPRIFMALKSEDTTKLQTIIQETPAIPEDCQWCTFLRNHDELTLEMVTEEERRWMWRVYAPQDRMRLNLGIRRRLAPLLDNNIEKIMLAHRIIFSLPGAPIIYYGDEIGMGDNINLPDRDGVRTPMQWSKYENAGFSTAPGDRLYSPVINDEMYGFQGVNVFEQQADPDSLLNQLRSLITLRKQYAILSTGTLEFIPVDTSAVLCFTRSDNDDQMLILHNFSYQEQTVTLDLSAYKGQQLIDVLSDLPTPVNPPTAPYQMTLAPYQSCWFKVS